MTNVADQQLERIIEEVLARRRLGSVQVVITGEDESTLPETLAALEALHTAGYELRLTLSYSASAIRPNLLRWRDNFLPNLVIERRFPAPQEEYSELFLPALSGNSLAKIALCLRDNVASAWAFHALRHRKKIVATLNGEFARTDFPPAVRQRQQNYIETLQEYGVIVPGSAKGKSLLSLADIRAHPEGASLRIDRNMLITPAARDEIARRRIRLSKKD
ncbi:hypothetical protein [Kalamiella sp. sgz302252]|uniref:hypothetical protein n=1 Tax=Pantoea sp. sgz302252 TaxID=3341827 RepID=UPI0036D357F9